MRKMLSRNAVIVGAVLCLALILLNVSVHAQNGFTATYRGQGSNSSSCNTTFRINGREPSVPGQYPLFIFTVGTGEDFRDNLSTTIITRMAQLGFVAASVEYDSPTFGNCNQITGKAECIYDANSSTSAVSVLCSRNNVDCNKGIVVAGFSQGSIIADVAKNYDPRVEAAWGLGDGVEYTLFFNLRSCVANGNRALPSERLRVVNGERDGFLGPTASGVRSQSRQLTGRNCGSSAFSCLQPDGSGWYIVQNGQTLDNRADHCYMAVGGCTNINNLDPNFVNGNGPFSINTNLNWLKSFVRP